MACRTGFYLILAGDYESRDILPLIARLFAFMQDYEGEVPGATARDCGNYLDMNLNMARYQARRFMENTLKNIDAAHLVYGG